MSKQGLTIPRTLAEEAELQTLMSDSNAVAAPEEVVVSGQNLPDYLKSLPTKAAKSVLKQSPLRLLATLADPPKLSPKGHDKNVIQEYATDPKRATFDKKTKRWYDVPVLAYSESTGKTIINDLTLQRLNLDIWGKNQQGQQGLIVDSKGRPVEFGHGTTNALKGTLDPDKTTSRSEFKGIYSSTEQREYTKYMQIDGEFTKDSKVHKLFLRMYNPLKLTSPEGEVGMDSFVMNEEDAERVSNGLVNLRIQMAELNPNDPNDSFEVSKIKESYHLCERPTEVAAYLEHIGSEIELTPFFQSLGYDGVLQQNVPHGESEYTEAIMFEKGNIKSSIYNKGTFLENDDLLTKTKKKPKKDLQIVA
jgi:hypothetical protein